MLRFWDTLLANLVFLICLMPLVGALLVAASARLGIEAIRRTAVTNALLTFSLTVLMAAHYHPHASDPATGPIQMSTSWPWLQSETFTLENRTGDDGESNPVLIAQRRGLNVRIALGVDGISLWLMVLTATLMIPATLAAGRHEWRSAAVYYALLLLLEAGLMGVFAALDVVFYLMALGFIAIPLFWLIAQFGGYERLPAAKKFFAVHLAGTLLVTCGLLAAVTAHARMNVTSANPRANPTFDARQLVFGGQIEGDVHRVSGLRELVLQQEAALDYWNQAGPWIFLALFIGFSLHAAVVPWHLWMTQVAPESPASAGFLLSGIGPALGAYGMARYVVPLFPAVHLPAVAWIPTLGVCGAIFAALVASTQNRLLKLAVYIGASQVCLGMAGLFSYNVAGLTGGILLIASSGLATAALMFVARPGMQRMPLIAADLSRSTSSRRAWCLLPACISIIGVPGLGGFVGQFLVLQGLFDGGTFAPGSPLTAVGALLAIGLVAWAMLRFLRFELAETSVEPAADDFSLEQYAAVGICLTALLLMGVFPASVTGPMEQSALEAVGGRPVASTEAERDEGLRKPASERKSVHRAAHTAMPPRAAAPIARPRA